jgi:hypothetical protein
MSPDGEYLLIIAGLCTLTLLAFAATALIIGPHGAVRRPHLPARAPRHEPGHARGGPLAIAPPAPGVVYRANARSELVRQRAARIRPHIDGALGMDRREVRP